MEEIKKTEVIDYYTNTISINTALFECVIEFDKEISREDSIANIEKLARIRMSPQLLKVFSGLLNQAVLNYEAANGPINININNNKKTEE